MIMTMPRTAALLFLVMAGSASLPDRAAAAGPAIVDLVAGHEAGRVYLDFRLAGAFDRELLARLESGLPTTLVYELELLRDRKRWFDSGLDSATVRVTTMYNALTDEYLVNYEHDGELIESRLLHDRAELEPAMTSFVRLPVFTPPTNLETGRRMLVRVRAVLGAATVLGFVPTERSTDWVESNKFRLESAPGN